MRKGSLPRSIIVPAGLIGQYYSPDGLTEADIDVLLAEVSTEVKPAKRRPSWASADQAETRRARHRDRQAVRALSAALSANVLVGGVPDQGKTSATRHTLTELALSWPDNDEVA
jgi:hypothetical protein